MEISYVVLGYMEASYQFGGGCETGIVAKENFSRRLQALTARISVRYHPPWI
jgi:hypothetical protein